MKQEEFDNRIKQKLEGLDPAFNEKDWNRLSQKMSIKKPLVTYNKKYLLLLLLLFVTLYGTWSLLNSNHNHSFQNEDLSKSGLILADDSKNGLQESKKHLDQNAIQVSKDNFSKLPNSSNTSTQTHHSKNQNTSGDLNVHTKISDQNQSEIYSSPEMSMTKKESRSAILHNLSDVQEKNNLQTVSAREITQATEREFSNVQTRTLENSAALISPIYYVDYMKPTVRLNFKPKPSAGLKPAKWMAGVTGLITSTHLNSGVAIELKTKKNISFGTGFVLQDYYSQSYRDQKEFNDSNDGEFSDLIRPRHSKAISFTNIHVKSTDVLLPLQLKYYIPLDLKYAIFAGASMHLTLFSKTTLDFKYQEYDTPGQLVASDFYQPSNSATLIT
jgi:hypothetical protein